MFVLSFACAVVATQAFDFFLKFGSEEACIISDSSGKEFCGHMMYDQENFGDQGCILTDEEGWVCA